MSIAPLDLGVRFYGKTEQEVPRAYVQGTRTRAYSSIVCIVALKQCSSCSESIWRGMSEMAVCDQKSIKFLSMKKAIKNQLGSIRYCDG